MSGTMKVDEKYKRVIKVMFAVISVALILAIYNWLWVNRFNQNLEIPYYRRGNWVMVFLYAILLIFFMKAYGGFKVGYLKKWNLIYSQILSILFVNIFTYFQIAIIDRHFFNPVGLINMTLLDVIVLVVWTLAFNHFYIKIFPPRKLLLVSGEHSDYHLLEKMNAREDKYEIKYMMSYKKGMAVFEKKVKSFDGVIIGDIPSHERNVILKYCFKNGIRTYSVPKISDILLRSSIELNLFDSPLLLSRNIGLTIEQQFAKRCIDVIGAMCGLIIAAPFFLIIAACIKLTDGGPVFYKQTRLTMGGKLFEIYKFRTMIQDAEKESGARLASDKDPRILPVGRLLRATRMDELPQLFNILKGEMSIVGPRPERPELAEEISKEVPEFNYRLKVKAGLTGYAQVYGKYNTTSYDKLKLDLTYIRNYSIWLDLKLIVITPKILFMKESTEGIKE